jgi:Adenylate and Guanylate cyclase catalytic domain
LVPFIAPGGLSQHAERREGGATIATRVKTIGDAVMVISADPGHLLRTTLTLVDEVSKLKGFPAIRAGLAHGEAHGRAGDWYGETVNLASRITQAGPPARVMATDSIRKQARGEFRWTPFVAGELEGMHQRQRVYSVGRGLERLPNRGTAGVDDEPQPPELGGVLAVDLARGGVAREVIQRMSGVGDLKASVATACSPEKSAGHVGSSLRGAVHRVGRPNPSAPPIASAGFSAIACEQVQHATCSVEQDLAVPRGVRVDYSGAGCCPP